ncbi:family 43 glycosylhydrolase [Actinomadura madurae]|uniref:family 43 glycosylhydrolase n=1 Tax=Actinomadura madurae TaxID=1993 RepID=UPI0020D243E5|nr:family 43 glycosylhydrolase [Actinomadura madurae]MCP9950792.1 family 43 glycosylhydrolase [Actinomadura madurae]MCP9967571.1 family 43 glycosylhydrolase [Actinomadura madurae]MCP9980019.1 family 43 glycosylhydrolase [Actinomadura madurae]
MRRTVRDPQVIAPLIPLVAGAAISALVALVVGLAVSCGPSGGGPDAGPSGRNGTASGPPPSPAGSAAAIDPPGYSPAEPVIDGSFADPTVIKVAGTYFAYGTNNADATMPVATAPSPTGPWRVSPGDGLARLPAWAAAGWTWAPEVVPPRGGSRSYLLYFSARRKDGDEQCVGVATASSPAGPFVPQEGGPLVCPLDLGGAIDPASYIEEDGTRYLLYKTDERKTAAIYLVRLTPDGLGLAGPPKQIMGRAADEPVLVEAPDLVRRGGQYVLLYSAGWYFQSNYQTRYAVASSIEGPYQKGGAVQSTGLYGGKVEGPGSADVLGDETGDYLVFHGILDHHGGSKVTRGMYVARLGWDGARPVVRGVPVRYEAERARLDGCVSALGRPNASGGSAIGPFTRDDCRVDVPVFAPVAGRYSVRTQYANRSGSASDLEVSVNGYAATSVRLDATKGADWTSVTATVDLAAGWSTLGLRRLNGQGQIDYLELR